MGCMIYMVLLDHSLQYTTSVGFPNATIYQGAKTQLDIEF